MSTKNLYKISNLLLNQLHLFILSMSSKKNFLGPKSMVGIATWNVYTIFESGNTAQVTKEMERYNLDTLRVSKCRWTSAGRKTTGFCSKEKKIFMPILLFYYQPKYGKISCGQ